MFWRRPFGSGFSAWRMPSRWVQVGGVWRQEDQVVALRAQEFDGVRGFVRGEVVGDNDLAGFEGRGQFVFGIGIEAGAVHRTVQHPGGDQASRAETRDEGLGVPVAEGGVVDEALADRGPAGGLDEVGLERSFVDEDQPFQHVGHFRLAGFNPDPAPLGHVGAQLFAGEQCFFYG